MNSGRIFIHIGILASFSLPNFEFRPYFYNHRNSGPILTNTGILISSFHCKLWNSGTILLNIGILVLFSKHCNSHFILRNTGILALFLYTLVFRSYSLKPWDSGHISRKNWIVILFFQTLEVFIFIKSGILPLSFHTLELFSYFYKLCISPFILPNTRIIALYIYALVFWTYSFKHWNSYFLSFHCKHSNSALGFWPFFIHIGFLIPSF